MSIHSPFRYAGGKFYARKLILDRIPPMHHGYCEPFAGGGSIFFAKNKCFGQNLLNDRDPLLILVYQIIRDEPEALIDFLLGKLPTQENHHYYKNIFKPLTDIEIAGRWYFLNRISYSGIMNAANCYYGYGDKFSMVPANWPRVIRAASRKLHGVTLAHRDFEAVIDEFDDDDSFLFVDPPYYNADQEKFYTVSFTLADHVRLAACLQRNSSRLQFLLTYDNCDEVKNLYHWTRQTEMEWTYCISRTDDQKRDATVSKGTRKKGRELFLSNY